MYDFFQTGAVSVTFHGIGKEVGTAVTGYLFNTIGTTATLITYAVAGLILFIVSFTYSFIAKLPGRHEDDYQRVPETE